MSKNLRLLYGDKTAKEVKEAQETIWAMTGIKPTIEQALWLTFHDRLKNLEEMLKAMRIDVDDEDQEEVKPDKS